MSARPRILLVQVDRGVTDTWVESDPELRQLADWQVVSINRPSSLDRAMAGFRLPRLSGFDLVVALSPASRKQALDLTRQYHLDVEYWPIMDPTGIGETRETKLAAYRQTRDQIRAKMIERFGAPRVAGASGASGA